MADDNGKSETNSQQLTIKQILAASDTEVRKVDVPEWGGYVYLRTPTVPEKTAFEITGNDLKMADKPVAAPERMFAMCYCDQDGKPISVSQAQIDALAKKSGRAMDRVFQVGNELTYATDEETIKLAKN